MYRSPALIFVIYSAKGMELVKNWWIKLVLRLNGVNNIEELRFKKKFPNYCFEHRQLTYANGKCLACINKESALAKEWNGNSSS